MELDSFIVTALTSPSFNNTKWCLNEYMKIIAKFSLEKNYMKLI